MNIAKHSGSKRAFVTLDLDGDQLEMRVRDEGKGFVFGSEDIKGIGLNNMEERVRLLNGKLIVNSAPGEGTEIVMRIPALARVKQRALREAQVSGIERGYFQSLTPGSVSLFPAVRKPGVEVVCRPRSEIH